MLSPTVLNNLHSTEAIPSLYWVTSTALKRSPTVLTLPPSLDVLYNLQCTEQPPQYWTDVIWGWLIEWDLEQVRRTGARTGVSYNIDIIVGNHRLSISPEWCYNEDSRNFVSIDLLQTIKDHVEWYGGSFWSKWLISIAYLLFSLIHFRHYFYPWFELNLQRSKFIYYNSN